MQENNGSQHGKRDVGRHLDRIWRELKDLTRQVETETRRGGQIAKLHYDIRGLRQELSDQTERLGALVSDAQRERGRRPALARLAGYDELIVTIESLHQAIAAKQRRIEELGGDGGRRGNTDARADAA